MSLLREFPELAVQCGLCDPKRPHVKNEPHPSRKIDTPRLIMAPSLLDQMVERYYFTDIVVAVKSAFPDAPGMLGIGQSDQLITLTCMAIMAKSEKTEAELTASDVSGWERHTDGTSLDNGSRLMGDLARGDDAPLFKRVAVVWAAVNANAIYILAGILLAKLDSALMPSGTFLTTLMNCIMRGLFAEAAGNDSKTVGDDCLEWSMDPKSTVELYRSWGLVVRDVTVFPRGGRQFIFCSHEYDARSWPFTSKLLTWAKMIYKFANSGMKTLEKVVSLRRELQHNEVDLREKVIEFANTCEIIYPGGVDIH